MSEITILDYSQLNNSELIKEDIEIIKSNIQDISSKILDTGRRLIRLKENLPHGQFLPTLEREFDMGEHTAREFMRTFKTFSNREHALVLEGMSRRAIKILTSAMSNKNLTEDVKEQIIEDVKTQTEEKSKPLTEKEIKEITQPYLTQIAMLEQQNKQLSLTVENNENLNSDLEKQLKSKEQELRKLADKKAQLENKERELKEKELTLKKDIDIEVKTRLETSQKIALADIEQQKAELKNQEKELKSQIRKQTSILEDLNKQKKQFVRGAEWLRHIKDFNSMFTERALGINVISRIDELSSFPNFQKFTEDEKELFEREFSVVFELFERNHQAWQNATNQIYSILQLMKSEMNISQAIDTKATID